MEFEQFLSIRKMYARVLPEMMRDYRETGRMHHDPYFMNWVPLFTPIEEAVWGDIRCAGIPFFPQLPVLNYFLDFGCPFLKIGIECDGKAWHDSKLDKERDIRLAEAGWSIFRIEGHECKRSLREPWDGDVSQHEKERWFMETSEGIVFSIKTAYFDDDPTRFAKENMNLIRHTLFEHNTTPSVVVPQRRPLAKSKGPMRLSDCLEGYIELIMRRAKECV